MNIYYPISLKKQCGVLAPLLVAATDTKFVVINTPPPPQLVDRIKHLEIILKNMLKVKKVTLK
jgi:hypothetical protein